jgi:glycosyltransferase involved in cell wall biosynthesis
MKILYFHQHFTTPSIGGGTRSYEFARKLIERGHEVTVVCGRSADLNLTERVSKKVLKGTVDGINVLQIELGYSNKDNIFKRSLTFLKFALLGVKIARKEEHDLLFATSTPLTAGIPGIFVKLFRGKKQKFVFEVRDLWPQLPKALGLKNPILLGGMSLLEKMSYNKADACIGLSPGICDGIKNRLKTDKEVKLIPNGCDLDIFSPDLKGSANLPGISNEDTLAVFTGAHGVANGLDAVLDMASELLKRQRNDIKIAFIGNGKVKTSLMERAKNEKLNNCFFYDPISKLELSKILASADIGLMVLKNVPEFYYGTSPNKFFDYISSGLAVVNNYPGWLADMIQEHKCGIVVEPNNEVSFADAIEKIADKPELKDTFGKQSYNLAKKYFSREELANEFVDFLEDVAAN